MAVSNIKIAVIGNRDIIREDVISVRKAMSMFVSLGIDKLVFCTGGAKGVDTECIKTSQFFDSNCYVYLPRKDFYSESLGSNFRVSDAPGALSLEQAKIHYPKESNFVRALTARNYEIISGKNLDCHCDLVLYLCKKGLRSGTGKAVTWAMRSNIECWDIREVTMDKVIDFYKRMENCCESK